MGLCAAAVCPHPPLLVPAVAAGAAVRTEKLLAACDEAVQALLRARPDTVLVVGDAPVDLDAGRDAVGSLREYGLDVRAGGPPVRSADADADSRPQAGEPTLPLSCTIGAWLLDRAGWQGDRRYVGLPDTTLADEAAAVGARACTGERSIALLVMGDGSARRSEHAPGYLDARAEPFDAAVARALAGADTDALLALDPTLARELMAAGRASWQVLAGACVASRQAQPAGPTWTGRLLADTCPYGVGYLVAVLERGD